MQWGREYSEERGGEVRQQDVLQLHAKLLVGGIVVFSISAD